MLSLLLTSHTGTHFLVINIPQSMFHDYPHNHSQRHTLYHEKRSSTHTQLQAVECDRGRGGSVCSLVLRLLWLFSESCKLSCKFKIWLVKQLVLHLYHPFTEGVISAVKQQFFSRGKGFAYLDSRVINDKLVQSFIFGLLYLFYCRNWKYNIQWEYSI